MYLFDEPEAALSPQRQLTLLMEIYACAKQGAQFIIVTHSPILLGIPNAQIISFDDGIIHKCEYEDTLAFVCWYAKGKSKPAFILSILILAVFFNMTFVYGWGYFETRSVLELAVFIIGFIALAFLLDMVIPFHFG